MANNKNGKIYWNFERPIRAVTNSAVTQGLAVVLDTSLSGETGVVPAYILPTAGVAIDGVAFTAQDTAGGFFDLITENDKYIPIVAGNIFGVGAELAVTAAGKMVIATAGQLVVAKSVNAATEPNQIVTALRIAPYAKA